MERGQGAVVRGGIDTEMHDDRSKIEAIKIEGQRRCGHDIALASSLPKLPVRQGTASM